MAEADRCDVAVWDVEGTLTSLVRPKLMQGSTHQGPQLIVASGDWLKRRVAIGRPRRLTAARLPTISEGVRALTLAHPPRLLVVLGPAAVVAGRGRVGDTLLANVVSSQGERLGLQLPAIDAGLPWGLVSDDPIAADADEPMTAAWAGVAARMALDRDAPTLLLAVAVAEGVAPEPPTSRPRTRAREAGSFLGKLMAGKWRHSPSSLATESAASALEKIVNAL